METVADLFLSALDRFPNRSFVREYRAGSWSYLEAARRIAATAQSLIDLELKSGDRLICYLEDITTASFIQLACAHTGIVPVQFSPRFAPESVAALAERVAARAVFTLPTLAPSLLERGLRVLSHRVGTSIVDGTEPLEIVFTKSDSAARALLDRLAAERRPGDVYMFQPTSGTTGNFNLVMRTHAPFLHIAACLAAGFDADAEPPARFAWTEPLTHGPGNYDLCTVMLLGAEGVIPSERDAAASLAELRELDPVVVGGPPRLIRSLFKQYQALGGEASGRWFGPSAAVLASGGGIAELEAHRVAERQGLDVVEIYAMTETGFIAITERGQWREGFVGRVLPGVTLKTAPDGELLARTPWQLVGYYGDPELTASRSSDGFFHTGDYCEVTADGWLRYLGRKKDIFNTPDGSNIHPAHIEQLILDMEWARQVALIGDSEPFLIALLVVREEATVSSGERGFLEPERHRALHEHVQADLCRINSRLATNERVCRFALFNRPMSEALYKIAGQGKIGRNRREIQRRYQEEIGRLYLEGAPPLSCVPGSPPSP